MGLGAEHQILRRPGSRTPFQVLVGNLCSQFRERSGPGCQLNRVLNHIVVNRHLPDQIMEKLNLFTRNYRVEIIMIGGGGFFYNGNFIGELRIVEPYGKHKTVELGFRKRIRAFLLDRILGGQHKKGLLQNEMVACRRHSLFLHGFQQRRLGFGRRPVDLIGQNDIGKNRTGDKPELTILVQDLRADDIRWHQIGGELDPVVFQSQNLGNGDDQQRLCKSRNTNQQTVTPAE